MKVLISSIWVEWYVLNLRSGPMHPAPRIQASLLCVLLWRKPQLKLDVAFNKDSSGMSMHSGRCQAIHSVQIPPSLLCHNSHLPVVRRLPLRCSPPAAPTDISSPARGILHFPLCRSSCSTPPPQLQMFLIRPSGGARASPAPMASAASGSRICSRIARLPHTTCARRWIPLGRRIGPI
jgi:hypothetical protein